LGEVSFPHCRGKQSYTYALARQLARKARRWRDEAIAEYHCKACGLWHIGHSREKAEKQIKARETWDWRKIDEYGTGNTE
jgi:hypothetical protein